MGTDSPSFTTPALTDTTSYWVRVTNAIGSADSRTATVTVLAAVSIHDIQGAGHLSPLAGQPVAGVTGIVTGVRSNGFYLQEPDAEVDANTATSEGILVFTSAAPPAAAAVGNHVSVSGTVLEFRPSATNLTITEITSPTVSLLSTGNSLPSPTTIGGAAEGNLRQPPLALIDEDAVAPGEEGGTVEDAGERVRPHQRRHRLLRDARGHAGRGHRPAGRQPDDRLRRDQPRDRDRPR